MKPETHPPLAFQVPASECATSKVSARSSSRNSQSSTTPPAVGSGHRHGLERVREAIAPSTYRSTWARELQPNRPRGASPSLTFAGSCQLNRWPLSLKFGRRRGTHFPYSGRIMVRVFLSRSSKDKPFVRDPAAALEAGGEIERSGLMSARLGYGQNIFLKITRTFLLSLPPTASCRVPFGGTGAWWDTRGNPRDPGASASRAQMAAGPKPGHQARQPDVQSSYRW
jgi:hypothetical protein